MSNAPPDGYLIRLLRQFDNIRNDTRTPDEDRARLSKQFDNIREYFLAEPAAQGRMPDAWKTPEEKALVIMISDQKPPLAIGDKVRIKPNDSWLQPMRKLAAEGRLATITFLPNKERGLRYYRVVFDAKRKGSKPVWMNVNSEDVEIVQSVE